jgi:hypothetical protein
MSTTEYQGGWTTFLTPRILAEKAAREQAEHAADMLTLARLLDAIHCECIDGARVEPAITRGMEAELTAALIEVGAEWEMEGVAL